MHFIDLSTFIFVKLKKKNIPFITQNAKEEEKPEPPKIEPTNNGNNTSQESEVNTAPQSPDHPKSLTLPMKLDVKQNQEWDELDELLQVERKVEDGEKLYQTMPESLPSISSHSSIETLPPSSAQSTSDTSEETSATNSPSHQATKGDTSSLNSTPTHSLGSSSSTDSPNYCGTPSKNGALRRVEYYDSLEQNNKPPSNDSSWIEKGLNRSMSGPDCLQRHCNDSDSESNSSLQFRDDDNMTMSTDSGLELDGVVLRRKQGSTAIRRRPGGRRQSKRRLRRRCSINGHFYNRETSFFTPPHGSQMSVWVTSLVSTQEVINLMLDKYKVDAKPDNFALFIVRDNGGKLFYNYACKVYNVVYCNM